MLLTTLCWVVTPTGAVNAANEKVNAVVNALTGEEDAVPATARYYKSKGLPWVVIGEWTLAIHHVLTLHSWFVACCCVVLHHMSQGNISPICLFCQECIASIC